MAEPLPQGAEAVSTEEAAALVTSVAPRRPVREKLAEAGLHVLGPCERLSKRPALMQRSELLEDFTAEEADILGEEMLLVRAAPGQRLIAEDEPSDWMMLLLSGTVDVRKRRIGAAPDSADPQDVTRLAVLREGAVLGEMSMLDGEPRYASCWAIGEVEVGVLTRNDVARLIREHPGVSAKLLVKLTQLLAQRLRNTSSQLVKALSAARK